MSTTVSLLAVLHDATEAGASHVEALRGQIVCDWERVRATNSRRASDVRRYGLNNAHMRTLVEAWNDPTLRLREPLPINPRAWGGIDRTIEGVNRRVAQGNIVRVTASPASIAAAQRGTARVVAISDHAITLSNGVTSHGDGIYSAPIPLRFTSVGQRVTLTYDHASQQWRGSGDAPSRPANNGRTKRQERAHQKRRRRGRT